MILISDLENDPWPELGCLDQPSDHLPEAKSMEKVRRSVRPSDTDDC